MSPPSSMVSPSAAASHTPAEAAPAASSSTPTQSHRRAKSSPLTSTTQYAGLSLTKYVRVPAIAVRHIVGHVVNGPRVPQWTVVDSVMVGVTRWLLTGGEAMVEYVDDLWLAGALDRPEDYDEDVEIYDERGVAIVRGDAAAVAVAAQRTVAEETVQKTTQSDSAADVAAVEFAKFQVGPALTADSDNGPNTTSDIVKKRGNAVHPLSDLATKQDINAVTASSVATSPASMTALSVSPPQLSPSSLAASLPVAPRSSSAYGLRVLRKVLRRRFRINRLSVVDQKLLNMMAQRPLSSSSDAFHPLAERYHEVMSTTLPTASATTADPWTWNVPMKHLKYRVEPVRNIQRMDQLLRNIYTYKRPNFFPVRNPDYAPFMGRCHGHEEASASATGDALHPGAHAILYEDFPKHDPRRHSFTGPFCRDDGEMMYAEWTVFEAADNAPESVRTVVPSKEECKVVLYFHGGAMIFMQPQGFRAGAQHVAKYTGARVFVIDNRLAPEHMYPDPLYDAIAAYVHLIRVEGYRPDQIFFMGDSAGGNLTFAAALFLLDHHEALCAALGMSKEELGRPAGIIGSSPWVGRCVNRAFTWPR